MEVAKWLICALLRVRPGGGVCSRGTTKRKLLCRPIASLIISFALAGFALAATAANAPAAVDGRRSEVAAELARVGEACSGNSSVGFSRLVRICENNRIDRLEVESAVQPGRPETIIRPYRGANGAVGIIDKIDWVGAEAGGGGSSSTSGTPCDDARENIFPGLGGPWGFNVYNYYTNRDYLSQLPLGTSNNGDAAIDDIGIAARDWQGLRNPGCTLAWGQGGTFGPSVDNAGHFYINRAGDCSASACRASLLTDGMIGGNGVANGRNEVVGGRYHTGDAKVDYNTVGYARVIFNSNGSPVESDISLNARLPFCSVDTQHNTCAGTINRYSVRDAMRHEIGHALGFDHTCGDTSCSKNTMNSLVYGTGSGAPFYIGRGEVDLMRFVYGATG